MKIAVINFSGNVGKSTIARHLIAPRIPGAHVVSVETINADGAGEQAIKGNQFGQLQEDMLTVDNAIVDIGSSNVEMFLALMKQYRGSHEDFDMYLVPCVPDIKQQKDTVACITQLNALGIPAEKIKIVLNKVPAGEDVTRIFEGLFAFASAEQMCQIDDRATIFESEIFTRLKNRMQSIEEIGSDARDIKGLIVSAKSPEEKSNLAAELADKRLAQGVIENLNQVWAALNN